jgi:DNA-binding transcriptional MocR family regulator
MLKYVALMQQLEQLIQTTPYKDGQRLPSIRQLAELYPYTKNTIIRALMELERRHIIYSVPKSGYYVVKSPSPFCNLPRSIIDFSASSPDPSIFPYEDFRHCINKAIDIYREDLFTYGTSQGLPALIEVMRKLLMEYQVFTNARNIFVMSGVQQALALLSTLPFPNGKSVILLEQPSYHLFIQYIEASGLPYRTIQRTAAGIDLGQLEALFSTGEIKFFYTMPRFHNPLGSSFTKAQKLDILALAHKYDVYIVEDDYLADLDTGKNDPLYTYDEHQHVIYLKSYSKIIFPGLRIGTAVIPDILIEPFQRYKLVHDIDSSMLSQGALEIYLKSGMFESHVGKIVGQYQERSEVLHDQLRSCASAVEEKIKYVAPLTPCIHSCLTLAPNVSIGELRTRLKKHNIIIDTMDSHYIGRTQPEHYLKLNVSRVASEDIKEGIKTIMKEI